MNIQDIKINPHLKKHVTSEDICDLILELNERLDNKDFGTGKIID